MSADVTNIFQADLLVQGRIDIQLKMQIFPKR